MPQHKIPLRKGWKIIAIIFTILYALTLLLLLISWDITVFVFFTIVLGVPSFIFWMIATKDRRNNANIESITPQNPQQGSGYTDSKVTEKKEPHEKLKSNQMTKDNMYEEKEISYDSSSEITDNITIIQESDRYTFEELRLGALKKIPRCSGIYKVYMPHNFKVKFRSDSDAPYTRNQLKDVDVLQNKWLDICKYPGYEDGLLYIGKSTNLRRRISEFVRTGYGDAINHYGGSSIFQIENNKQLQIKIFVCENCEEREAEEIDAYIYHRKVMPLANWSKGNKKNKMTESKKSV